MECLFLRLVPFNFLLHLFHRTGPNIKPLFFFPVPCLYSLNKTCLNLQYHLLSLVLNPW